MPIFHDELAYALFVKRDRERRRQEIDEMWSAYPPGNKLHGLEQFTVTSVGTGTAAPSPAPVDSLSSPTSSATPPTLTHTASASIDITKEPLQTPSARCSTQDHSHDERALAPMVEEEEVIPATAAKGSMRYITNSSHLSDGMILCEMDTDVQKNQNSQNLVLLELLPAIFADKEPRPYILKFEQNDMSPKPPWPGVYLEPDRAKGIFNSQSCFSLWLWFNHIWSARQLRPPWPPPKQQQWQSDDIQLRPEPPWPLVSIPHDGSHNDCANQNAWMISSDLLKNSAYSIWSRVKPLLNSWYSFQLVELYPVDRRLFHFGEGSLLIDMYLHKSVPVLPVPSTTTMQIKFYISLLVSELYVEHQLWNCAILQMSYSAYECVFIYMLVADRNYLLSGARNFVWRHPFTSCLGLKLSRQPWPPPMHFQFRGTKLLVGHFAVSYVFDRGKSRSEFTLAIILHGTLWLAHIPFSFPCTTLLLCSPVTWFIVTPIVRGVSELSQGFSCSESKRVFQREISQLQAMLSYSIGVLTSHCAAIWFAFTINCCGMHWELIWPVSLEVPKKNVQLAMITVTSMQPFLPLSYPSLVSADEELLCQFTGKSFQLSDMIHVQVIMATSIVNLMTKQRKCDGGTTQSHTVILGNSLLLHNCGCYALLVHMEASLSTILSQTTMLGTVLCAWVVCFWYFPIVEKAIHIAISLSFLLIWCNDAVVQRKQYGLTLIIQWWLADWEYSSYMSVHTSHVLVQGYLELFTA